MEAEKTETCLIFFNTQIQQNKVIPKLSWRETARETKKKMVKTGDFSGENWLTLRLKDELLKRPKIHCFRDAR